MGADVLAMQWTRASATMILTWLIRLNSLPARLESRIVHTIRDLGSFVVFSYEPNFYPYAKRICKGTLEYYGSRNLWNTSMDQ